MVEESSISSTRAGRLPIASRGAPMPGSALPNLLLRTQSDDRLVELMRGGSERAFTTIVERYRAELVRYSSRFVDRDLAEDVVQQALMNARRGLRRDARAIALRPWLYRICHNVALNECRRTRVHEELDENFDGVPQPPEVAQTREDLQQLVHHMTALPARQREALTAYELEGRGYAEIAAAMDTGQSSVRGLIARARVQLRDACGALVPLPLLRQLVQAPGVESPVAGAAAAGGVGLAVKAAAVVTAASVMATGAVVLKTQGGTADSARGSASGSAASPAQAVVPREYHYDMPFELQADGPYFNLLDFFARMSRLSRIINVGDLKFDDPDKATGTKYPLRPGTTVTAVFTATTFFTKPADVSPSSAPGARTAPTAGKP